MSESAQVNASAAGLAAGPARRKVPHRAAVRRLSVAAVERLTPSIQRVTLVGTGLAGFESSGPTDHLKVFFPEPVVAALADPKGSQGAPGASGATYPRDYTARAFRDRGASGGPELDLDVVLHDDGGPASTWAASAAVGDPLVVVGPRSSKLVPEGFDSFLLLCDETALPAVARWLELIPADAPVLVLAEISADDDTAYLGTTRPGVQVEWLRREGAAAGTSDVLEQALRAGEAVGPGTFVWAGGEATSLVGVRRYLRRELGLPARQVEVGGYWRRGTADFDHHAPIDPTDVD